jgi:hypothetical protein
VLAIIGFLADIGEAPYDLVFWRRDWDRTWSPVSYWFAAIAAATLVVLGILYGAQLRTWVRGIIASWLQAAPAG